MEAASSILTPKKEEVRTIYKGENITGTFFCIAKRCILVDFLISHYSAKH
jgi:hypothetical protein